MWYQMLLWRTSTTHLYNTLEDMENCEHSEDVGMFIKIQELAKLGKFYAGDVDKLQAPHLEEQKGQGLGRVPSVSQTRSSTENT